jgi:heme/copper-type cytochrome/quinol oxidase subunit 3
MSLEKKVSPGKNWDARARARLAMAMFLIAAGIVFALLLIAFIAFRDPAAAARSLNPAMGVALTASLVLTACAVWRAEQGHARLWLGVGLVGGIAFVALQAGDFARLISGHVTAARSLFGTTWFTLAGVHGISVLAGLVPLAALYGSRPNTAPHDRHGAALSATALYWYFLSAVWILIFAVAYLGSLL